MLSRKWDELVAQCGSYCWFARLVLSLMLLGAWTAVLIVGRR
jgi:hypothetical protein